jgi:hypothetical protein
MIVKTKLAEYHIWYQMKRRCYDPKCHKYKNYGGRGITICDTWLDPLNGFQNFLGDVGYRPGKEYSIERIDVNGNYSPENCKWILMKDQVYNKTNTLVVETGTVYNNLTVIEEVEGVPKKKGIRRMVKVICKCGNIKVVRLDNLIHSVAKSCGHPSCNKYAHKSKYLKDSLAYRL